jgi:AcrR family transcriptional regulator
MDKRTRIIAAARTRFRDFGVRKTTMQEIAADAGVAVGTLYLYFKDKSDLLAACTDDYVERHRRAADAILAARVTPEEKLRRYLLDRYRAAAATRTGSRFAAEVTRAVLKVRPDRPLDEARIMAEYLLRILALGVESGRFHTDDPEHDVEVLLYSIAYFFPTALAEPHVPPTEAGLLKVVNWFIHVWRRPASGRRA